MRAPKENSPEARTYMGTEMERDAGDWLRRPMRRHQHGVEFNLGHGVTGGFRVSGMPQVHTWDGSEWVLPDYSPKLAHDGSVIFQPVSGVRWAGDTFHGQDGRAVALRSAGVLDKGLYHPLWQAGPLHASPFLLRQTVGPFEHEVHVLQGSMRNDIIIHEMPTLPGGDALAFEFCADRMLPPEQCPCHPWYQDAVGHRADVTKLRWFGGRYEYIPLTNLEHLTFPVVIDPEVSTQDFQCSPFCQSVFYAESHACAPPANAFAFVIATPYLIGQFHTMDEPSFYGTERVLGGWPSGTTCGIITSASVKMACYFTGGGGTDDIYFKRAEADGHTCGAGDARLLFQSVDVLGTTKVGDMAELRTTGCSTVTPVYAPYYPLAADDITHLNTYFGFGNSSNKPLYYGLQSKDDNDETTAPWSLNDAKYIRVWPAVFLKYESVGSGGYIWLVGG
jgi:hypothetical protein